MTIKARLLRMFFAVTDFILRPLGLQIGFTIDTVDEFDRDGNRSLRVVGTRFRVERRWAH